MNNKSSNTEELIQKIVERQAELVVLTTTILKAETKKESKPIYAWFWNDDNKNNVFELSKAI